MTSTTVNRSWAQRQRMAVLGLLTAAALVGCSGASGDSGDAAGGTPSPSRSSASPSPTATPTAAYKPASAEGPAENVPLPVMPEEAKVQSKEGLEAFARYWYELVNYGFETGDTEPIRAISGPDCPVCNTFYETVELGFANNGWIAGGEIDVQDAASEYISTPEGRYQVLIQQEQTPMSYCSSGGVLGTGGGTTEPAVQMIEARYAESGWYAETVVTIRA